MATVAMIAIQNPTHSVLINSERGPPGFKILLELTAEFQDPTIQRT